MTKPSTAFSWTTVATYRDAIPGGVRDSGFIPNTLVSSGYTNQALFEIGEWVTYLSDLSPADDVLAFREWECPDDSSYQLAWNGPAGTDGRMDGRMNGRTGGQADGRTTRRTGGRSNGRTDGRTCERTHGRADGRTDGGRRTDGGETDGRARSNGRSVERTVSRTIPQ